jgi:glycosyltransferase involved in cell wall biosynthesis
MIIVMLLGPSLAAVSGVSTHLNQLFSSSLAGQFQLLHFQVGSEGRKETRFGKLRRFMFSPLQFAMCLIRQRPHIIHVNTSMELKSYWRDMVYMLIARVLGKKLVYQVHGGALPQDFFPGSRLLTALLKRVLYTSDLVVVLAQRELCAYHDFAPDLPLALIPNAIEIGPDPVAKSDVKQHAANRQRPLRLVYVGRLAQSKGIYEIVDALAIVRGGGNAMQLVMAGSGPDEAVLRSHVRALGLQDAVHFAGIVTGLQKDQVWQDADVFVFPTFHEGLPYALLESMAARTPPVVSCVGAVPDVVQDGVHGLFIPCRDPQAVANALLRLDQDRALLHRMGRAGRQRIEAYYTVDRLAEDFARAYRTLAS